MKILNKLTIKNLKLNKKRTIVTMIGISLSVALICAITTFVSSFQSAMVEREIIKNGNYYIKANNVTKEQLKYIENNKEVESFGLSQDLGYAKLDGIQNENKPYVYVESFDDYMLNHGGLILTEGRMPENENEILVPDHLLTNGKLELKVGDKITLNIGDRLLGTDKLNQNNPYFTKEDVENRNEMARKNGAEVLDDEYQEEKIEVKFTKEYTIVGIIERPSFEDFSAPGYTVITKMSQNNIDNLKNNSVNNQVNETTENNESNNNNPNNANIVILLKNASKTYEFSDYLTNELGIEEENITENESLLQYNGVFKSNRTQDTITILAVIVIAIIIFTSAFVIRNSFNISLTEKTKELGMLASIGATPKQIRKSIFFEGFILSIIAIPIGIILGIVAIWIVLLIVNNLMKTGQTQLVDNFDLKLVISLPAILIAIIVSCLMILISTIKPSIRAGKISPIDAIRENQDIKIKTKRFGKNKQKSKFSGSYKIRKKLFGIEGVIASKNFKRSRKKYMTTIFSIAISIILFISMNSFVENVFNLSSLQYSEGRANIHVNYYKNNNQESLGYFNKIEKLDGIKESAIVKSSLVYSEEKYYTTHTFQTSTGYSLTDEGLIVLVRAIGDKAYKEYIKELGLKYEDVKDKAILYDTRIGYEYDENKDGTRRIEYNMLNLEKGDTLAYKILDDEGNIAKNGEIEIALRTKELPLGGLFESDSNVVLIVSDEKMEEFDYSIQSMYINAENPSKLQEEIIKIDNTNKSNIYNIEEQVNQEKNMVLIISIFLYGFIAVISIIGITNIFNTITTNMALRNREFAILKSIGMQDKEFNKMINYESLIYGIKSLLIGIPIGLILSYLIYKTMGEIYLTEYKFPTIPIIISIVFVMAIIFITMNYAVRKTRKQNIIETIRGIEGRSLKSRLDGILGTDLENKFEFLANYLVELRCKKV